MSARASRSSGASRTRGRLRLTRANAAAAYPRLRPSVPGSRGRATALSTAWARVSSPVMAVTLRGMVTVSSGSRSATRGAALGSPQAIFPPPSPSPTRAKDWTSEPVPAVVGTAISGRRGEVAVSWPR